MKKEKQSFECTLYNILFRLAPLARWKVKIMDRHQNQCPYCSVESLTDQEIAELAVTLKDADSLPPLHPVSGLTHSRVKRLHWGHAAAYAALTVVLLWTMLFFRSGQEANHETEQVVVRSVKLNSKAAKYYIFPSNNPDKLIVWTQAKRETNGG